MEPTSRPNLCRLIARRPQFTSRPSLPVVFPVSTPSQSLILTPQRVSAVFPMPTDPSRYTQEEEEDLSYLFKNKIGNPCQEAPMFGHPELWAWIASYLDSRDCNALNITSRSFYHLLNDFNTKIEENFFSIPIGYFHSLTFIPRLQHSRVSKLLYSFIIELNNALQHWDANSLVVKNIREKYSSLFAPLQHPELNKYINGNEDFIETLCAINEDEKANGSRCLLAACVLVDEPKRRLELFEEAYKSNSYIAARLACLSPQLPAIQTELLTFALRAYNHPTNPDAFPLAKVLSTIPYNQALYDTHFQNTSILPGLLWKYSQCGFTEGNEKGFFQKLVSEDLTAIAPFLHWIITYCHDRRLDEYAEYADAILVRFIFSPLKEEMEEGLPITALHFIKNNLYHSAVLLMSDTSESISFESYAHILGKFPYLLKSLDAQRIFVYYHLNYREERSNIQQVLKQLLSDNEALYRAIVDKTCETYLRFNRYWSIHNLKVL